MGGSERAERSERVLGTAGKGCFEAFKLTHARLCLESVCKPAREIRSADDHRLAREILRRYILLGASLSRRSSAIRELVSGLNKPQEWLLLGSAVRCSCLQSSNALLGHF